MDQSWPLTVQSDWPDSGQCTVMTWTIFKVVLVMDPLLRANYIAATDSKCQALGAVPMKRKVVSSCPKENMSEFHSASPDIKHPTLPWHHVLHNRQVSENCCASSHATSDGDINVNVAAGSLHQRSRREVGRAHQPLYGTLADSLPDLTATYDHCNEIQKISHPVSNWEKWLAARFWGLVHHHHCRWNRCCCWKLRRANASWQ